MYKMFKKRWRPHFHICGLLFIILLFSGGCYTPSSYSPPDNNTKKHLTRIEYYNHLYNTIQNNESLRSIYTPTKTTCDAAFLLADLPYYENNSYNDALYELRSHTLSHLTIEKHSFLSDDTTEETYWIWCNCSKNAKRCTLLGNFFTDYETLTSREKEIIEYLYPSGLILYDIENESSQYYLNISKEVTKSEQALINGYIENKIKRMPPNIIETNDQDGNDINLCFCDPFSMNILKSILNNLLSQDELCFSFVYFDNSGTTLSIWINSLSCGVFSIPLSIEENTFIEFPCASNELSISQRLDVAAYFIPNDSLRNFDDFKNQICKNKTYSKTFNCLLNSDHLDSLTVSVIYLPTESSFVRILFK